jgi:Ca-activated chloride channel family protein
VSFGAPELLLALVGVPLAALGYAALSRRRAARATAWSEQQLQPNTVSRPSSRFGLIPPALFLIGLGFLLLGFARPQRAASSNGREIGPTVVLAFDVSGSMAASDLRPGRLAAARELALEFVRRLPSKYELAIVTFANKAHVVVPPTVDRAKVIRNLPKTVVPLSGTAVGDGISASVSLIIKAYPQGVPVDRLHPLGAVVVLSDGTHTAGGTTPQDAASTAYVWAVPINSAVIGTSRGSVTQPVKVSGFRTSVEIAVPAVPLALQSAGQLTGGATYEVRSAADAAATARKLPGAVKRQNLSSITQPTREKRELSAAAGAAGLVFVVGGIVLSGLWFGRVA